MATIEEQLKDRVRARLVNSFLQFKRELASEGYNTDHLTVGFVFSDTPAVEEEPIFTGEEPEKIVIEDHMGFSSKIDNPRSTKKAK